MQWKKICAVVSWAASVCAGCTQPVPAPRAGIANPASVWCVENRGGKLEIRRDASGASYGVCILPDGTEAEEWELWRRCHEPRPAEASGTGERVGGSGR